MTISTVNDGYSALCEAVITNAIQDMKTRSNDWQRIRDKYLSCQFFLDEESKSLFTGLAPHMIRDWEHAEETARETLATSFADEFTRKRKGAEK